MLILEDTIYQAVAYGDIFNFPLTVQEIHRYLPGISVELPAIESLLQKHAIVLSGKEGYYTLPGREALAGIRKQRESIAARIWPQALQFGKLISGLPFVRMVAVTGALAMNNVDSEADIDYLIVTEPGHIWLTRAQTILLGRYSHLKGITLCPNYLISTRSLVFPDQTLYTAHELAQMIPLAGLDVYDEIRRQNAWVLNFLPNAMGTPPSPFPSGQLAPRTLSRPTLEAMMQTPPMRWLENWEMERKIRRLRNEQIGSAESTFSVDVCKGHIHRHQLLTSRALEDRLHFPENA